jgi:hypothetical protein
MSWLPQPSSPMCCLLRLQLMFLVLRLQVLNLLVAVLYELFLEELEGAEVKHAGSKDWLIMHKVRSGWKRRLPCVHCCCVGSCPSGPCDTRQPPPRKCHLG